MGQRAGRGRHRRSGVLTMRHCKGCSHPTICNTHGCAADEHRRNKLAKDGPHAAAEKGDLPPPDLRMDGLADYYRAETVLRLLNHEREAHKKALAEAIKGIGD